jgi:hypothetical protein
MDKRSSLGMPMSPQEISKRYKRQSLGMPLRHPFFIGKNQVTFQHTIFLLLHALCVFLGASLLLISVFFCFFCCNKWLDPKKFLLEEMYSLFICQEHSIFSLLSFNECSLFLELCLAFVFRLDFCSDLVLSLHQGVFGSMLVFIKRVVSKRFEWCWKREKVSCSTKRSLFRLRLRLLHAMLDVILIVYLVIFAVA